MKQHNKESQKRITYSPAKVRSIQTKSNRNLLISMIIVAVMILSSFAVLASYSGVPAGKTAPITHIPAPMSSYKRVAVPSAPGSVIHKPLPGYSGNVNVLVTFNLSNQTKLNSLLSNLSNPNSPGYHQFINRIRFAEQFGPSSSNYAAAEDYFLSFPNINVKTYGDRVSMSVTGPSSQIGKIFNTSFVASSGSKYFATSSPTLPSPIARSVSQVVGLTDRNANITFNYKLGNQHLTNYTQSAGKLSYPTPGSYGSAQLIYGSDLQVAYNEQTLLNITYPTNSVEATILWSGQDSSSQNVGPYYPYDINAYFNQTLPSYEPHPKVFGVPLSGAPKPGSSSLSDASGANVENTLDLQMVGSMAPGSSIYNVYGANATLYSLDSAFSFILNPNATFSALNNVSVITNSWGAPEFNDTAWYSYLQEAQTRGISVLASSGDSGDNQNSTKFSLNPSYSGDYVQFPSNMAFNTFGITAVGGTTLTLTSALQILNQVAWYQSGGSPAGSTGGISQAIKEPSFQMNTEANSVIQNAGRGVPDVSAIANNTVIFLSSTVGSYYSTFVGGTSVASPVTAGMIAEIDAVLAHYGLEKLGYLNPLVYQLGNLEFKSFQDTATTGYVGTGTYNSTLPLLPFAEVDQFHNNVYSSLYAYDLVTGWGSINAYNFTDYVLNLSFKGKYYAATGVANDLNLSALKVTTYQYDSVSGGYTQVYTTYNASIQQNFFLADEMGAPLYWVQNVIYINGSQAQGWAVNYTGWVIYPFYGQEPQQSVYEYNFPAGRIIHMPHDFNISTALKDYSTPLTSYMEFSVNSHTLTIPVPGAAYIISAASYSYSWEGKTYSNGPYPGNPSPGGLAPQFGIVGGPSLGLGIFQNPTAGNMTSLIQPYNASGYTTPDTGLVSGGIDQTGEIANGTAWTVNPNNEGMYTLNASSSSGSTSQGVYSYLPTGKYAAVFNETGLPRGTTWYANISGVGNFSSDTNSISVYLNNGTYYSAYFWAGPSEILYPVGYSFNISGYNAYLPVSFAPSYNSSFLKFNYTFVSKYNQTVGGALIVADNLAHGGVMLPEGPYAGAVDNRSGDIYTINPQTSALSDYNQSLGFRTQSVLTSGYLQGIVYDYRNNMLLVGYDNNLLMVSPYSLNNPLTSPGSSYKVMPAGASGEMFFQLVDNGNELAVVTTTGIFTLLQVNSASYQFLWNTTIKGLNLNSSVLSSSVLQYADGNMFFANEFSNNVIVLNMSTGKQTSISFPAKYFPMTLLPYGNTGKLIAGGYNYSYEVIDPSTLSISAGPYLNYSLLGEATNSHGDISYFYGFNQSSFQSRFSLGHITAFDTYNSTILATVPADGGITGLLNDPSENAIYTVDSFTNSINAYALPDYYKATFTASGLPAGSIWYLNISGEPSSGPISGSSFATMLHNGSYTYNVASLGKKYTSSGGSLTVSGIPASGDVVFSPVKYKVEFLLDNYSLRSGNAWFVNVTGQSASGPLTGSTYSIDLSNGTYSYTVHIADRIYHIAAYSPIGYTGQIKVTGGNQVDQIMLEKELYSVTFDETGLSGGTSWTVVAANGTEYSSTGSDSVIELANGTYTFTVANTTTYYSSAHSISVTVNGGNVTEKVQFSHFYFLTGSLNPAGATVTVNGVLATVSNGKYNVSVTPGTYEIVVSASGYKTYYENVTTGSNYTDVSNVVLQSTAPPNSIGMHGNTDYIIGGIAAVAIIGGSAFMIVRRRRA